ncbi:unnamed protein product [Ixodes persulcatus]
MPRNPVCTRSSPPVFVRSDDTGARTPPPSPAARHTRGPAARHARGPAARTSWSPRREEGSRRHEEDGVFQDDYSPQPPRRGPQLAHISKQKERGAGRCDWDGSSHAPRVGGSYPVSVPSRRALPSETSAELTTIRSQPGGRRSDRKVTRPVYHSAVRNREDHVLPPLPPPQLRPVPLHIRQIDPRSTALPRRRPADLSQSLIMGPAAAGRVRSSALFAFSVAAFVLLCSGAITVYYVWYSHREFARHRDVMLRAGNHLAPDAAAATVTDRWPSTTPNTDEQGAVPATTSHKDMYFGTPLSGRRRVLKLRHDNALSTGDDSELASRRRRCLTKYCQDRSDALMAQLNWTVSPCVDFYGFACSRWASWHSQAPAVSVDSILSEDVERELYLSLSSKLKPEVWKVEGLLEECLRNPLPQASRLQLRTLLRDVGLHGWPFRSDTKTRGEVWKAAALIFRHLGLAPLVGLSMARDPHNASQPVIALDEPSLLVGQYWDPERRLPRWYTATVNTAFKQFTPGRYLDIADRVNDFSEKLAEIATTRGRRSFVGSGTKRTQLRSYSSYAQLLGFAFDDLVRINERTALLVRCDRFLRALKSVLHTTRNHDVLNYLGFRVLVHLSPALTEETRELAAVRMKQLTGRRHYSWPRWRRCLRLVETAAPELLAFSFARTVQPKLERLSVLKLARDLAIAFNATIGNFSWMASSDKENARIIASSIDVQVFYPTWMGNATLREAYDALFPDVIRGNLIQSYRDFVRKLQDHRLAVLTGVNGTAAPPLGPWRWSVFDSYPSFDLDTMSVYVPPAMFNATYARGETFLAAQLPIVGPKLVAAFLEGVHEKSYPASRYHWSLNSTVRAVELELCLARMYGNATKRRTLTMQLDFLDNMALEATQRVYLNYVTNVRAQNMQDHAFLSPGNLTAEQLFYTLYAMGHCENADKERLRVQLKEDPFSSPRDRVNGPLKNHADFAVDWDCRPRTPMAPKRRCALWTS